MSVDYEIRAFRPGDEASLLETYNRVFHAGDSAGGGRTEAGPRSADEWSWAFERNPAGRRVFVALDGDRVVAQYAALPTRMLVEGQECTGLHVVDTMVHPEHRSGARQPGLFVLTARAFFAAYGGLERDPLHFGWPVDRAWRVGRRLLDYEVVRVQNAMVAELADVGGLGHSAEVEVIERFGPEVDALARTCANEVGASTYRDADHLNWRIVDHPRHAYRCLGVGSGGARDGVAIWRRADLGVPNLGVIVDWMVPLDNVDQATALLERVADEARAEGLTTLALWCPEWSPWCAWFQERGFRVQPTDYLTTARSWSRRHDPIWLRDHWWYQLSDTDLV